MPGPSLTTDAIILMERPPADAFQTFTAFSPSHGALRIVQRLPAKAASAVIVPDLFDEVSLLLEGAPQGDAWFVKESRLLVRHTGIGRNYEALVRASAFATLVARNPVAEESRATVHALLRTVFAAFASGASPDTVYLKSLYAFARDEGYPLKQAWFPALPAEDRPLAAALINQPLAAQTVAPTDAVRLLHRLEDYLRRYTDIHLD
ncbi:MAG: hypothetical protein JF599_13360 [Verrucomicrobia bacterium]|nr:hypothetical protein [Verrucomicrobiota bacterium]